MKQLLESKNRHHLSCEMIVQKNKTLCFLISQNTLSYQYKVSWQRYVAGEVVGMHKLCGWGSLVCHRFFGWSLGSSSAMTPLLPGIVFQPLRFYEAAVTGRANSKRPESTKEIWQAAGA